MPPENRDFRSRPTDVIRRELESAFKFPLDSPRPFPEPKADTAPTAPSAECPGKPARHLADFDPAEDEVAQLTSLLREKLGEKSYRHCFEGASSFRISDDEVVVGVASPFLLSWMQKVFRPVITEVARWILGPSACVRFEVDGELASRLEGKTSADSLPSAKSKPPSSGRDATHSPAQKATVSKPQQDGSYRTGRQFARLEDFLVGTDGSLAMTAIREVCQSPGQNYNPLYLHGGVGLGKTHLLEGIYRNIRTRYPALRVLYLTAEAFTNFFTVALREKTLPGFRQRFRNLNVLLIDDLDFLDSKRGIQEEFLHTFKQLETQGGQIAITADRHPRLLNHLSEELMTRCLSGLVCRLEVPEQETRQRIAAAHSARQKIELSREVLEFVARRFSRNVRELQGGH